MTELYSFLFCLALGVCGRLLYIAFTLLAKRTDLMPVTVVLDISVCLIVGGAFAAYVILSGAVIAPYMFAALLTGYLFIYYFTKNDTHSAKPRRKRKKDSKNS